MAYSIGGWFWQKLVLETHAFASHFGHKLLVLDIYVLINHEISPAAQILVVLTGKYVCIYFVLYYSSQKQKYLTNLKWHKALKL